MHILFPNSVLNPREPDEDFVDQVEAFASRGFSWSLCSLEELEEDKRGIKGALPAKSEILYRGWMLKPEQYQRLLDRIANQQCSPVVSHDAYLAAHYLPNWYPLIPEFTARTEIYTELDNLEGKLQALGWKAFFIKDFVKSLKTSVGAVVRDPREIGKVIEEMISYRGEIEGGLCVRQYEELLPATETRYFVIDSIPFASSKNGAIPEAVAACAERIPSPFFSVDVAQRADGTERIVEIGDGQVSDIVGWTAERLAEIWSEKLATS